MAMRLRGRRLRRTAADRAAMIARLYRVFEARIAAIEARFDPDAADDAERDTRVLAALARTLDILLALDRKAQADGGEATHDQRADIDTLRQDLAGRLDRLARRAGR